MAALPEKLTGYTSVNAHGCITQAFELAGIRSDQLRKVPVNAQQQIDLAVLQELIASDKAAGRTPFLIVGTAGHGRCRHIDNLAGIAAIAKREELWFHVDGACSALGMLSPKIGALVPGIELAIPLLWTFISGGKFPCDPGFISVRDSQVHYETFSSPAAYLRRESRGMATGSPSPCDSAPIHRAVPKLSKYGSRSRFLERPDWMRDGANLPLASYLATRVDKLPSLSYWLR